jgi:hypothetical protein
MASIPLTTFNFYSLFSAYQNLQVGVASLIACVAANGSQATPGRFLLVQFQLSQSSQVGDSISNLMSQLSSSINNAIRNFKSG